MQVLGLVTSHHTCIRRRSWAPGVYITKLPDMQRNSRGSRWNLVGIDGLTSAYDLHSIDQRAHDWQVTQP